jgi:hypothetical protein
MLIRGVLPPMVAGTACRTRWQLELTIESRTTALLESAQLTDDMSVDVRGLSTWGE